MHLQDDADFSHASQYRVDVLDVGNALVGVGGCAGGIEFESVHPAARLRAVDFRRIRAVGQIQRHQRIELRSGG